MTKKIILENLSKLKGKKKIFKVTQNWPFLGFFKFQTQIFLSFVVFHQKTIWFLAHEFTFVSPKKFITNTAKIMDESGGGGEKTTFF
jgi:hypothetical protein